MELNQRKDLENSQKNIIGQLWFKYFPYWPLFMFFLVLAIGGAWLKLRYQTPLYESSATILIKDEKKGEDESKMIEALNQLSTKKIIENEIEVIKSRALMIEVVKKLRLYAPVFAKGKLRNVSAYSMSPVSIESRQPDSLVETGKVFFNFDSRNGKVIIGSDSFPLNEWVQTRYGALRFIPRNKEYKYSAEHPLYFVLVSPKKVALSLVGGLDVSSASKLSSVIRIKIRDEIPRRSEDILNGLIAAYNTAAVNDKNTLAVNTLAFVDERLNIVAHDLDSIEQKLQHYKANRGAIDISSQGNLFLQNVSTIDNRLSDVNTQLTVLDKVESYVRSKDNSEGIVPSTVGVTDPLLSQLLDKLYTNKLEYEKLKKTTAENNPMLVSLKDQIDKIRPSILDNIRSQKTGLEVSKNNLDNINNKYSSMLSSIPQKEKDLVEISREHSVKSSIYNFLLQKREETAMSLSSSMTDSRIVDKAQSTFGPVSPKKKKVYAMAMFLAFALAVGLVTLNELLKRTILFRHEIEAFTSIPVIGEIVYDKSKDPIVIGNGKRSFIAEQFRNLRTSLHYIGLNAKRKKLLITSTVSGEGKSFIVANLGISLALAGKKVILLEFDLSNPTVTEKLNVTVGKGLADYLNGEVEPEEIVRRTSVHENLFIMPAGTLPENPSELIMSDKVPELLEYLTDIFDYVIIDSAPVGLLSDAYVLSAYADATLYVVRHRHTRKISIQRLDENNKVNELKNAAIVFNGVRARGFNKNGYGYGYGYGYIYNEKKHKKKREPRLKNVS